VRCGHGGRARPARAKTAVRLPRIPATGRELHRAPRSAVPDGARRGPDRLPGRHPPGQRGHLAADRITGCAGDLDVPPDVDSLAHKLPGITAVASGEQAGSGPARPHLQLMAFRGSGARVLAPAIAPVITRCPPGRRHRGHPGQPSLPGRAGDLSVAGVLPPGFLVICQAAPAAAETRPGQERARSHGDPRIRIRAPEPGTTAGLVVRSGV